MDFSELKRHQHGAHSVWQLRRAGWSRGRVRAAVTGVPEVHHGVHVTGDAPLTFIQRCWAAVLTEPGTYLAGESLAHLAGMIEREPEVMTVCRRGDGGVQHHDGLVVHRSKLIRPEDIGTFDDIPCLHPGRVLLDLIPTRGDRAARRLVRNALRRKVITGHELHVLVARHRGRKGVARLRTYTEEYARLQLERTKSDAEALALALLAGAKRPMPLVNVVVDGGEADMAWPRLRRIIELDEPYWHQFPTEDARKQAGWEAKGWQVDRLPTSVVYEAPERFLALAPKSEPAPRRPRGRSVSS